MCLVIRNHSLNMNGRRNRILKEMIGIEGLHVGSIREPDPSVRRHGSGRLDVVLHSRICTIESVKNVGCDSGARIVTPFGQLSRVNLNVTTLRTKPERAMSVFNYRYELHAGETIV